ncbi:MAG: T9SS C-terminal target domain-containing protein [Ignavibacteriae bacterium]|nr:MAG: T9SS C-terminal target domain-containing protein [Ignavibacteriota bacterium]
MITIISNCKRLCFKFIFYLSVIFVYFTFKQASAQWVIETSLNNPQAIFNYLSSADSTNVWVIGSTWSNNTPIIYRRFDGIIWLEVSLSGISNQPLTCIAALSSSTAFVGAGNNNASMYKTTNNGNNWQIAFNTGGNSGYLNDVRFSRKHPAYGYACSDPPAGNGTPFKIYKTSNYGQNWTVFDAAIINNYVGYTPSICVTDSNHAWFGLNKNVGGSNYGKILCTTNGGLNFSTLSLPMVGYVTSSIEFKDNNLVGMAAMQEHSNYYFKTTNGGLNWNYYSSPYYFGNCKRIISIPNSNVWYVAIEILGPSGRILKSTDDGTTWVSMSTPGNQYQIEYMDAVLKGNKVYAFAVSLEGHILKLIDTVALTPVSNEGELIPDKYILYQNYPNPFNPTTKIRFDIPSNVKRQTSNVKLVIHNVIGKEITTLINEQMNPGTYEVEWDASNYPSGIYYYKLTSGDYSETKKMIFIK